MTLDRCLLIETSGRKGRVGLANGDALVAETHLDAQRRHARDLVPAVRDLLTGVGWRPVELNAVAVSLGPGSYTGLRVGIMAARSLAYALGRPVIGVPTFAVIAEQADVAQQKLHVIADALKGKIYEQQFSRAGLGALWSPAAELRIVERGDWLAELRDGVVSGSGVDLVIGDLPRGVAAAPEAQRVPGLPALLRLARRAPHTSDALGPIEPLYLRASSAEEQWSGSP